MTDFQKIDNARRLLNLDESATLQEIKESFRKLSLKHHPDRSQGKKKKECEEMFKKINQAYEILMGYCAGYKYSFKERDVKKNSIDEELREHLKRFYDGWWDNLNL